MERSHAMAKSIVNLILFFSGVFVVVPNPDLSPPSLPFPFQLQLLSVFVPQKQKPPLCLMLLFLKALFAFSSGCLLIMDYTF